MVDTGEQGEVDEVTAVEDVAGDTTVYPGEVVLESSVAGAEDAAGNVAGAAAFHDGEVKPRLSLYSKPQNPKLTFV